MQPNSNQYQYDFSYSVTFQTLANQVTNSPQGLQRQFMQWFQIFSQLQIINNPQYNKSIYFLFRINLLSLYNITHQLQQVPQNKQHQLEKCRQSIYTILQQFDTLLGAEKSKYIILIILCFFTIIRKTIQKYLKTFNQFQIFHLVYWEIKGQLINKQNMQVLIKKYFDMREYQKFILLDQEQLTTKKTTQIRKIFNMHEPLTFRSGVTNQNKSKKSQMLYQSFKDISLKRANKQNQIQNNRVRVGQSKYQTQQNSEPLNFNVFKKKIQQKYQANVSAINNMEQSKLKFGMLKQNSQRNIQVKHSPRLLKDTNSNPISFRPYKITQNYK